MKQKNNYQFEKSFLNHIVHKEYYGFLKNELSKLELSKIEGITLLSAILKNNAVVSDNTIKITTENVGFENVAGTVIVNGTKDATTGVHTTVIESENCSYSNFMAFLSLKTDKKMRESKLS